MSESWAIISGYGDRYEVSSDGRVRRRDTQIEKIPTINKSGYPVVSLWYLNVGKTVYVHDLVASAFIGPKPVGMSVNHINGRKIINHYMNLEYVSLAQNTRHAMSSGLNDPRGEKNGHAILTDEMVRSIRKRAANGERQADIVRELGMSAALICQVISRQRWRHVI